MLPPGRLLPPPQRQHCPDDAQHRDDLPQGVEEEVECRRSRSQQRDPDVHHTDGRRDHLAGAPANQRHDRDQQQRRRRRQPPRPDGRQRRVLEPEPARLRKVVDQRADRARDHVGHEKREHRDGRTAEQRTDLGDRGADDARGRRIGADRDDRGPRERGGDRNEQRHDLTVAEPRPQDVEDGHEAEQCEGDDAHRSGGDAAPGGPSPEVRPDQQEERRSRQVVDADDLDDDRQPAREPGDPEPPLLPRLEPAHQGGDAARRQEEVEPGGHRGRVVRDAPHDDRDNEHRSDGRRGDACRDVERGDDEHDEEREHRDAQPEQVGSEDPEDPGVEEREPAGVRVDEVAMRQLAVQHALRHLPEGSLVPREPAAVQRREQVEARETDGGGEEEGVARALSDARERPRRSPDCDHEPPFRPSTAY